jgi:hypothetical protein
MAPFGWVAAGGAGSAVVARSTLSPSRSVDSMPRSAMPVRPRPASLPARRTSIVPTRQLSPSTRKPAAAQASGGSATVIDSIVTMTTGI